MTKHKPRFLSGSNRHNHHGRGESLYTDGDCPICCEEYCAEAKWEMLGMLKDILARLPFVDVARLRQVIARAEGK